MRTGLWKQPVGGPQMVRRLNIDGDGQGDLDGHGGEQRAVLVYQFDFLPARRARRRGRRPGPVSPSGRSLLYYTAAAEPVPAGVVAGRLNANVIERLGFPTDASAYVCRPEMFMNEVSAALTAVGVSPAGVSPANIYTERFSSRSAIIPGIVAQDASPPHQPSGATGTRPQITFARSGLSVRWTDDYASLLDLAEACDVPTRWSCRTGVCHTCVTAVLSGGTEYTTAPLEEPGPGEALICSSRPIGDVVLDL